jgi:Holliday junction DNA helicase RuvA
VTDLAQSVASQDHGRLTKIPGIGKKTAERLLLELRGKFAEAGIASAQEQGSDVLNALLALGYSDKEARAATRELAPGTPVAEAIRTALRSLAKS